MLVLLCEASVSTRGHRPDHRARYMEKDEPNRPYMTASVCVCVDVTEELMTLFFFCFYFALPSLVLCPHMDTHVAGILCCFPPPLSATGFPLSHVSRHVAL